MTHQKLCRRERTHMLKKTMELHAAPFQGTANLDALTRPLAVKRAYRLAAAAQGKKAAPRKLKCHSCARNTTTHRCRAVSAATEERTNVQSSKKPLRVMIAGAPAAGKGTQCVSIVKKHGLVHISAGDLLRAEVQAGTEAGKKAKQYMDEGNLVPNEVVVEMVVNRLQQSDAQTNGWLLDGYPRSAEQAEAIEAAGIRPDVFILINVHDEELVERVVGRRLDPVTGNIYHMTYNQPPADIIDRLVQRSDDTEDKLRNRLAGHHQNVNAVVGYYTKELVEVDGSRPMQEVAETIDRLLTQFQQKVAAEPAEGQADSIV